MNFNIIVAHCKNGGIGIKNDLPWQIKSDLKKFRTLTVGNKNNAIIMGKNTWLSLNGRPLKERDNYILSTLIDIDEKTNNIIKSFDNITSLLETLKTKSYDDIWVIGGAKIYDQFMNSTDPNIHVKSIHVTYIAKEFECDTFFPKIDPVKYRFSSQSIHVTEPDTYDFKILDRVYLSDGGIVPT